jgi:hypothetical protein
MKAAYAERTIEPVGIVKASGKLLQPVADEEQSGQVELARFSILWFSAVSPAS